MSHSLAGAYAKVERARENLRELDRKSVAFVTAHPYDIVPRRDDQTGELVGVLRAQVPDEPVPLELGVIAGEFGHNLRSALNYLAIRLASPPVGSGPGKATQFPLYDDWPGVTYKKPAPRRFRDATGSYLQGVPKRFHRLIEKAQPYQGGQFEHLAFLVRLNNQDKHRVITTSATLAVTDPPDLGGFRGQMVVRMNPTREVRDGAEVFRMLGVAFDGDHANLSMRFDPSYFMGFGENPMIASTRVLWRSARLVELILRAFHQAF